MNFLDYSMQQGDPMNYNGTTTMDTYYPNQDAYARQPVLLQILLLSHTIEALILPA